MQPLQVLRAAAVALLLLIAACGSGTRAPAVQQIHCDRFCLQAHIDRLLDAMVRHDPTGLPLTANFQYRENNQALQPGDGSWQTLQSIGPYKHYFADPESGSAALMTLQREYGEGGLLTVRIHVTGDQLDEAEVIVTHSQEAYDAYAKRLQPTDNWLSPLGDDERMSREQLATLANKYYAALENNDGKGDYSFFDDDCNRLENGVRTTEAEAQPYDHGDNREFVTLDCRTQLETGLLGYITRIRDRRYEVIDVERGAVFAIATLDHDGTARSVPLTNGENYAVPAYYSAARSIQVAEALLASDGRLTALERTSHEVPYGQRTAFRSTFEPSSAVPGGVQSPAGKQCNRDCIASRMTQLLAAMARHDPPAAPLAGLVRYTENDQQIAIGDGLWGTLTQVTTPQLQVIDGMQAWVLTRVSESDLSGLLALRARFNGDRITDIEAQVIRDERVGAEEQFRVHLPVDPLPSAFAADPAFDQELADTRHSTREVLVATVQRWFTAMQGGLGNGSMFTAECRRRENAVLVTGNPDLPHGPVRRRPPTELRFSYADGSDFKPFALGCSEQLASGYSAYMLRIRDRQVALVDEARGVVVARAFIDVPGTTRQFIDAEGRTVNLPTGLGRPVTVAWQAAFKIDNGKVQIIEASAKPHAYGTTPAWPVAH
jgi:hypothetical protein